MKKSKVYINKNTMEFYKNCYLEFKNFKGPNTFSLSIAKFIIIAIKLSIFVTKLNMLNNVQWQVANDVLGIIAKMFT